MNQKNNPLVIFKDIQTFFCMALAILRGKYKMPWNTLIWIFVCIIYLISPVDALPDILPWLGIADDGAFVLWVLLRVHKDLATFRQYQLKNKEIIEAEIVENSSLENK